MLTRRNQLIMLFGALIGGIAGAMTIYLLAGTPVIAQDAQNPMARRSAPRNSDWWTRLGKSGQLWLSALWGAISCATGRQ